MRHKCVECNRPLETYRWNRHIDEQLRCAQQGLSSAKKELSKSQAVKYILAIMTRAEEAKKKTVAEEIDADEKEKILQFAIDEELDAQERNFYQKHGARAWQRIKSKMRRKIEKGFRKSPDKILSW